ncbi:MAG: hypothetical protein K6A30_01880 [Lachnospiraceae bacterium]|nr:hypothetical protein [Lachnospiraceae bacterium]
MRYVMLGFMCFLMFVVGVMSMLTVDAKYSRKNELEVAMMSAMKYAMEGVLEERIQTDEELERSFQNSLRRQITSKSELSVDMVECDVKDGILSAKVKETFTYPTGKQGELTVNKTIIVDREHRE